MKRLATLFLLTFAFASLWGCVDEFEAKLPDSDTRLLAFSGDILSDTVVRFALSRSFSASEENPPEGFRDIDATVVVVGSDGFRSDPARAVGTGTYEIRLPRLDPATEYSVEIEADGQSYRSRPTRPLYASVPELGFQQPEKEGDVYVLVSTRPDGEGEHYFRWSYAEDWEIRTPYSTNIWFDPTTGAYAGYDRESPFHICWCKNRSKEILVGSTELFIDHAITRKRLFRIDLTDNRLSNLYSVLVRQYPLTKQAYEYYELLRQQNQEMGGLFTPQPSEIRGNIECTSDPEQRMIGYVSVVGSSTQQRLFIRSSEVTRNYNDLGCSLIEIPNKEMGIETLLDAYTAGYRPHGEVNFDGSFSVEGWAASRCVDCTEMGGSKEKPDFWPGDYE